MHMITADILTKLLSFACMIAGMYSVQIYSNLQQFDQSAMPVQLGSLLVRTFRDAKFLMALAVSPIVFYPTCLLVGQLKDTLSLCTASFQNGFFWIYIFNAAVASRKNHPKHTRP